EIPPSGNVPLLMMCHAESLNSQVASAKPPSESNVQERMHPAFGSQPIICTPLSTTSSPTVIANDRRRKFWFLVHSTSVSIDMVSSSSIHDPTSHSSGLSCS